MATSTEQSPSTQAVTSVKVFADLRRRNEYAAQVARMLTANRRRRTDQAIRTQRQHWTHQSR